jgi:DNA polymerase III subunit epsilon
MLFAIVDIETTGSYADANGITEICIILHDGSRIVKEFETLVNPLQPIPRFVQSLTGITDSMVESAPEFSHLAEEVYDLLQDTIFVAHNVNFDYSFIRQQLLACGFEIDLPKLCTVRLARQISPGV